MEKERVRLAYEDISKDPYSHVWFDLTQDADDDLRLLGNYGTHPSRAITVY